MGNLLKPSWWVSMFVSTLMTMIFIYLIKKITNKFNVPVLSEITEGV